MKVIKRNDETEDMMFDKISDSISVLCKEHELRNVDASVVAQKICASLFDGIKTSEIDVFASETAASMSTRHPDYGKLAALLVVRNLHKQTAEKASEVFARENAIGIMSDECYAFVRENADAIDAAIVPERDFLFDYFGLKTLEKGYLVRDGNKPLERPQHLWMRVAIGIWTGDLTEVLKTYDLLSQKYFTHATPTLFNAAMKHPQLSSCFLMGVKDDSIDGIYSTLKDCAHISKWAGGIGVHIHNVRSRGSPIVGTAGVSSGVMPMLRVFNATARYVNQCFTPGTRVYVRDHGAYPIGNICPGMEVLTSDGTYRPVLEVAKKMIEDSEDILEIQVEHAFAPVHCTKEHEIYAIKKHADLPGFFPASELSPGDLVGFPVPHLDLEPDRIVYDEDLCFAYGAILRDGRVISDIHGRSNFSVTTSTQDTIVFFETFLASKGIPYEKPNDDTIQWSAPFDTFPIHETDVYVRETQQKYISPRFLSLPNKQRNAIVHGLMGDSRTFTTTSEELAYGLRELLLRLGTLSSGHTQDTYLCTQYTIDISDNGGSYSTDDVLWTPIQDIKTVKHTGHVFDLNVQDNHTYVTANLGIVHNSGKRNGSICMYMEPSHPDVFEILEARKNHGDEEARARDLFYALWIPDLFMRRVEANAKWSFFCPNKCPGLSDAYGPQYDALYEKYESEKRYESQIDAQKLWAAVCNAQMETGTPFMLYKDACNMKSNQKHLGTIKSSNLCTEIVEYTSPDEIAVCNLASVCLPQFVDDGRFDFGKLHAVVKQVTWNLDRVIDVTYYPIPEAERSNKRHRPIGIGIQGLADVFMMLKMDFEGAQAKKLNKDIFETMYHAAVEASCDRAETHGPYETFQGSPASHGLLQFDLWNHKPGSSRYDWQDLKYRVALSGLRNSLLLAPMPTASTSQIMGSNEAFEPYTSNIYLRRTLAGEFIVVNKHLIRDLVDLGLWNESTKNQIIKNQGSIQDIADIPDQLKPIYKTAWEMKQKSLIDMAADRGAFVCQSQSLNLFMASPTFSKLSSMHFYAWKKGLKTGMYYLRTKPAAMPVQFTIDPKACLTCSS